MNLTDALAIISPIVSLIALILTIIGSARRTSEKIAAAETAATDKANAAEKAAIAAVDKAIADVHGEFVAERAKHDQQIEALHSRINDVRDSFVRRDDFAAFAGRIEKTVETIAQGQITLQSTLVQALTALTKPP